MQESGCYSRLTKKSGSEKQTYVFSHLQFPDLIQTFMRGGMGKEKGMGNGYRKYIIYNIPEQTLKIKLKSNN